MNRMKIFTVWAWEVIYSGYMDVEAFVPRWVERRFQKQFIGCTSLRGVKRPFAEVVILVGRLNKIFITGNGYRKTN